MQAREAICGQKGIGGQGSVHLVPRFCNFAVRPKYLDAILYVLLVGVRREVFHRVGVYELDHDVSDLGERPEGVNVVARVIYATFLSSRWMGTRSKQWHAAAEASTTVLTRSSPNASAVD